MYIYSYCSLFIGQIILQRTQLKCGRQDIIDTICTRPSFYSHLGYCLMKAGRRSEYLIQNCKRCYYTFNTLSLIHKAFLFSVCHRIVSFIFHHLFVWIYNFINLYCKFSKQVEISFICFSNLFNIFLSFIIILFIEVYLFLSISMSGLIKHNIN